MPHKQVPILPEALSHHECSLHPNKDRYTFSCLTQWNQGKCVKSEFVCCKIRSKAALTYEDVDANNVMDEKIAKDLRLLRDVVGVPNDSHKLIEKLMLLANSEAAKVLMNTYGGGLLRKHDCDPMQRNEEGGWLASLWSEHTTPAEYVLATSDTPIDKIRHGSLGLDYYTHFTSPIRRYADQLVHRLLKCQLVFNDIDVNVIKRMNDMQKRHRRFQREMQMLQVGYAMDDTMQEYEGIVLPFRFSESKLQWKIDIAIPSIQMVYPLAWINEKTKWLFTCENNHRDQLLNIMNHQTGEQVVLRVGQKLNVRLMYRLHEPVLHKKCVLTCDTFAKLLL